MFSSAPVYLIFEPRKRVKIFCHWIMNMHLVKTVSALHDGHLVWISLWFKAETRRHRTMLVWTTNNVLQKAAISRCVIVIPKRKLKIKCQHFRFKSFDNLLGLSLAQSLYQQMRIRTALNAKLVLSKNGKCLFYAEQGTSFAFIISFRSAESTTIDTNYCILFYFAGVAFAIPCSMCVCVTLSAFDGIIDAVDTEPRHANGKVIQIALSFNSLICIWPFFKPTCYSEGKCWAILPSTEGKVLLGPYGNLPTSIANTHIHIACTRRRKIKFKSSAINFNNNYYFFNEPIEEQKKK